MKLENLDAVLQKLGVKDCSRHSRHDHKCITVESLREIYNIKRNTTINEHEFAEMSTMLLYSILSTRTDIPRILTKKVDLYEELQNIYSKNGICEQILDQILKDLNQSVGNELDKQQCFSANDLLQELNISGEADIGKAMIPELSMIIISKLLQRQCIEVRYQNPLPCSSYFVNHLFEEYAKNDIINKENVQKLMKNLKIGKHEENSDKVSTTMKAPEDKLARRKRQIVESSPHRSRLPRLASLPDAGSTDTAMDTNIYEKCYSAEELFSIYHVEENDGFKREGFESLSVALLDQIESGVCDSDTDDEDLDEKEDSRKKPDDMLVWGFGLTAVSAVSLISLFMIIPLLRTTFYRKSLVFLIALAIGTLVGDSMFHLLPRATGFSYAEKDKDYYWRFFSMLGGIYGFFLFETTAHLLLRQTHTVEITPKNKKYIEKNTVIPKTDDKNQNKVDLSSIVVANKMTEKEAEPKFSNGNQFDMEENFDDEKHIAPMAWTVIIGDTLHNIADGIAIGVAFSDSIVTGVGTSIAVLCHEVPHELGDFVVLLSAGMSVRQAVIANFVSSCFCFMGLVFGKLIGQIEDVNLWILGVTGGFFLYIALTNKLPELMHVTEQSDQSKITLFLLQNIGVIVGFVGMFFLAYYKKDINI
ncbi:zinc transporter ZIP14-like [Dendronephthya gigantea]|uniref:zinc transporter ZIP14-like n=1 Tax=Dendronephthya gigantea TaxID=151771 RepID=UPI00106A16C0|nr:zinc transporter ZIP14-like [Dendronephthya gigantea]